MNQQTHMNQNKRPITREEVTLLIGTKVAFRPVVDGRVHVTGVQILKRTDIRAPVFDYVPGIISFPESVTDQPLTREGLTFSPRPGIGHEDLGSYLKLFEAAGNAVAEILAQMAKRRGAPKELTHRLVIKPTR